MSEVGSIAAVAAGDRDFIAAACVARESADKNKHRLVVRGLVKRECKVSRWKHGTCSIKVISHQPLGAVFFDCNGDRFSILTFNSEWVVILDFHLLLRSEQNLSVAEAQILSCLFESNL